MNNFLWNDKSNFLGMGTIRTLLAISVVLTHTGTIYGYNIANGMVAVQIFYLFSGFYMFMILENKYKSLSPFYSTRALRLIPIYLLVLVLSFVSLFLIKIFGGNSIIFDQWPKLSILSKLLLVASNLVLYTQDLVMFLAINIHTGSLYLTKNFSSQPLPAHHFLLVPQAWTLSLEITFYALVPFLAHFKARYIFLLIALSVGLRFYFYNKGFSHDPWTYRFFPFEISLFLMGGMGFKIYSTLLKSFKSIFVISKPVTLISIVMLFYYPFSGILTLTDHTLYYVAIVFVIPFIFYSSKNSKIDRNIGEYSYPIYIVHILVNTWILFFMEDSVRIGYFKDMQSVPTVIVTIFISYLIIKFYQKPIEKLRTKIWLNSPKP